jgi:MAD (mothers against decapentaplegic) interacting protein
MEDKNTTVTIPLNRYDQVMKSMNNSSDHILAFAGNFSNLADSHLVCIQDTQSNENAYSTHAINIHNKPRKGKESQVVRNWF